MDDARGIERVRLVPELHPVPFDVRREIICIDERMYFREIEYVTRIGLVEVGL